MICIELPIYKKSVELIDYIDSISPSFSKEIKCSYAIDLRRLGTEMIKCFALANYSIGNNSRRAKHLEAALGAYETFKFTIRRMSKLHALSEKQAAHAEKLLAEIGEQLMGWFKKYEEYINEQ